MTGEMINVSNWSYKTLDTTSEARFVSWTRGSYPTSESCRQLCSSFNFFCNYMFHTTYIIYYAINCRYILVKDDFLPRILLMYNNKHLFLPSWIIYFPLSWKPKRDLRFHFLLHIYYRLAERPGNKMHQFKDVRIYFPEQNHHLPLCLFHTSVCTDKA